MLLRGFEMRKRSQGSETFLHLNAEKNEGDAKGGSERAGRDRAVIWVNLAAFTYGFTYRWGESVVFRWSCVVHPAVAGSFADGKSAVCVLCHLAS